MIFYDWEFVVFKEPEGLWRGNTCKSAFIFDKGVKVNGDIGIFD
jgi:hypothetical protein